MANLTETSGATYPPVRQIENGEAQAGGENGLWNEHAKVMVERTNNLKVAVSDLRLKAAIGLTVGPGGQYATINAALAYLSDRRPAYVSGGFQATITLKAGFVMAEQVIVAGIDLSWVRIVAEAASVNISRVALITELGGRYPAWAAHSGGRLPQLAALMQMDNTGPAAARDGVFLSGGGSIVVAGGAGIRYAGGCGLLARSASVAVLYGSDWRNAGENALEAAAASTITAGTANVSAAAGIGLRASGGSMIDAQTVIASGCAGGGARAETGAVIVAVGANCRIGASDASTDIVVASGGRIAAGSAIGGTNIAINTLTASGIIHK